MESKKADEILIDLISNLSEEKIQMCVDVVQFCTNSVLANGLLFFCKTDYVDLVNAILSAGADIESKDENQNTPLLISVSSGKLAMVKLLVANKADINALNTEGNSALLVAAYTGNSEIIEALLSKKNINLDIQNNNGYSALMAAVDSSDLKSIQLIIQAGANICVEELYVKKLFEIAINSEDKIIIQKLCQNGICVPNKALSKVVSQGDIQFLNFLLDLPHEINKLNIKKEKKYNKSALHEAIKSEQFQCAQILIHHGAFFPLQEVLSIAVIEQEETSLEFLLREYRRETTIEITSPNSKYLLHECIQNSYCRVKTAKLVELLLCNKMSPNEVDEKGSTPLIISAQMINMSNIIELLLDYGVCVNQQDQQRNTALHAAVRSNDVENVKCLLRHKADINAQNTKGHTPIFCLDPRSPSSQIIGNVLLTNKAEISMVDTQGNNFLMHLIKQYHPSDVVELLEIFLISKVNVNHANKLGETALIMSAVYPHQGILNLLIDAGADVNKLSKPPSPKSVISVLLKKLWNHRMEAIKCIECILYNGLNINILPSEIVHILIASGSNSIVGNLICFGLATTTIIVPKHLNGFLKFRFNLTPFQLSLYVDNLELANYLYNISFLTKSDLCIWSKNKSLIEECLISSEHCREFLMDITARPLSLQALAKIAISDSLANEPDRFEKIRLLGLPTPLQDLILFKNTEVNLKNTLKRSKLLYKAALSQCGLYEYDVKDRVYVSD